jgi:hypothetical protein
MPISVCYGRTCLSKNADPWWAIRNLIVTCGGVAAVDPAYLEARTTFLDGEYMTIKEALTRQPITQEEIDRFNEEYIRHCAGGE